LNEKFGFILYEAENRGEIWLIKFDILDE